MRARGLRRLAGLALRTRPRTVRLLARAAVRHRRRDPRPARRPLSLAARLLPSPTCSSPRTSTSGTAARRSARASSRDALPLLAVLLVPAMDARSRPLAAPTSLSLWPGRCSSSCSRRPRGRPATGSARTISPASRPGGARWTTRSSPCSRRGATWPRLGLMLLIAAGGLVAAAVAQWSWSNIAGRGQRQYVSASTACVADRVETRPGEQPEPPAGARDARDAQPRRLRGSPRRARRTAGSSP